MKISPYSKLLILCLTLWVFPGMLMAASTGELYDQANLLGKLNEAKTVLKEASDDKDVELLLRTSIPEIKTKITECITQSKKREEKINRDLTNLGEATIAETDLIRNSRENLYIEQGRTKEISFKCNELANELTKLTEEAKLKLRDFTTLRLSMHTETVNESLAALPQTLPNIINRIKKSFQIPDTEYFKGKMIWWYGILLAAFGMGLGFLTKFYNNKWLIRLKLLNDKIPFQYNVLKSFNTQLPWIISGLIGLIAFQAFASEDGLNLPTRIFIILAIIGFWNSIFRWLRKDNSPADVLFEINKNIPKTLVHRLRILGMVIVVGFVIFGTGWLRTIPDTEVLFPYQLVNIILGVSVFRVLQLSSDFKDLKSRYRVLRIILMMLSLLAVIATLVGFINAANYLLFALVITIIASMIMWILLWSIETSINSVIMGKSKTSYKLRASLGIRIDETSKELSWLKVLTNLSLWFVFAVVLLIVWDFTDTSIPNVKLLATDGFNIGENTKIVPANLLNGLIIFAIIVSISVWFKAKLERKWLRNIGMDRGSRDAVVTLIGYLGMIVALLLGLTAAGVSFAGMALIAGALSVGIGFGLQNIVNNFISGIILLFERPIKSGDYITVGAVEGRVKRISIRSTELETRQRTSVIVPNSELISGQVTNWVLHDNFGQLLIPVGVAYGSNTELVKKLMLEVAHEHEQTIIRKNMPQPSVRFQGFGDSSLNFAIVVLVKDIDQRFDIISDMNYMIDKKFRENGIEIPFPQRDVHFKMPPNKDGPVMPDFLKPKSDDIAEKSADQPDDSEK